MEDAYRQNAVAGLEHIRDLELPTPPKVGDIPEVDVWSMAEADTATSSISKLSKWLGRAVVALDALAIALAWRDEGMAGALKEAAAIGVGTVALVSVTSACTGASFGIGAPLCVGAGMAAGFAADNVTRWLLDNLSKIDIGYVGDAAFAGPPSTWPTPQPSYGEILAIEPPGR
jgi:hypothetical protein